MTALTRNERAERQKRRPQRCSQRLFFIWAMLTVCIAPIAATSEPTPRSVGQCTQTTIVAIGERLTDSQTARPMTGSGSAVRFANGLAQVSYDEVPQIRRSRTGDPVFICLMKLPTNCPPGDERGRIYTTTNLRTMESWTLADSQHNCGGA